MVVVHDGPEIHDSAKENLILGKAKLKAAINAVKASNRLQLLFFTGYLNRKEDSTTKRVTSDKPKEKKTTKFV